jgi:predicted DNA-binding transcriptional regulator YafY
MHVNNIDTDRIVVINYTNYKGETSDRNIIPHSIHFGHSDYHKENQWLLKATDIDKNVIREFALKDIHSWRSS